ncbi:MAG: AIR synthase related protein, partial [Micromonospora sp.]
PRPNSPEALRETVLRMIASPNLADKTWVTEQYDRYVLGNTVLAQPEDSGVIRIDERTGLGVALSVDGNGRYARLDPYQGTRLALAEAYRNVAVTGAKPIAVTNCLNFGSPEDPGVMWQFAEAVRGLADGCAELGIPVTGGNVSFYNQTGAAAIHPTPVVGVLGVLDNVADRVSMGFVPRPAGDHDQLFLLGETHVELSGSEWAWVTHEHLGGIPPQVDLARERQLADLMAEAARVGHLSSAHDLSDGGLAQSLVESCLRRGVGARVVVPEQFTGGSMPFVFLFSESAGRVLVSVPRGHEKAFTALCAERGVPWEFVGVTDPAGGALEVHGQFRIGLDELRAAHTATLPRLFGGAEAAQVQVEATRTGTTAVLPATAEQPVDVDPAPAEVESAEPATDAPATDAPPTDAATDARLAEEDTAPVNVAEPAVVESAEDARAETATTTTDDAPDAEAGSATASGAPDEPASDQR